MATKKVKTFKSMLAGLTCERDKIGHLMRQARADSEYDKTLAEVDVNAIVSFVVSKDADDRMAGIYLIDSICQNVGGEFVPLFEEHIFPIIETTFRYGTSKTRKSLCKMLNIWKSRSIFPMDILRKIYKSISAPSNSQPASSSGTGSGSNPYSFPPPSSTPMHPGGYGHHRQPTHFAPHHPPPPHHQMHPPHSYPPPSRYGQYPPPSGPYGAAAAPRYPPYPPFRGPMPPNHHQGPHSMYPPPGGPGHGPPHGQYPPNGMVRVPPNQRMNGNANGNGTAAVSGKEYEVTVNALVRDLSLFMESPYSYRHGIFVETPRLKEAQWRCRPQLVEEVRSCQRALRDNATADITRKLYFITNELKAEGVNTSDWHQSLCRIAPFLMDSESANNGMNGGHHQHHKDGMGMDLKSKSGSSRNAMIEICPMFNSVDGCRSGDNCKYQHVTDREAELRRKLSVRSSGRYQLDDVKFATLSLSTSSSSTSNGVGGGDTVRRATFYSFFGAEKDLKKKTARGLHLLYSKKLRQCPNCYLRVTADAFPKHMAWHFERRKAILLRKQSRGGFQGSHYGLNRNWYRDEEQWLNAIDENTADRANFEENPFSAMEGMASLNAMNGANGDGLKGMGMEKGKNAENEGNGTSSSSQFASSSVVIGGVSEVVICGICGEEFCKTNKEYNAQRDDWMLTNSCYADGSTSSQYPRGKVPDDKAIVHRTCYEAERRRGGRGGDDDDDALRPKLHNPSSTISKIEDQLNDSNGGGALKLKGTKRRRLNSRLGRDRRMNHLFGASDDEDDDEYDDDDDDQSENGGNTKGENDGERLLVKKRKLNGGGMEMISNKNTIDDLEGDEDDLRGMGIDELDEGIISKPITVTLPAAEPAVAAGADTAVNGKGGGSEIKDGTEKGRESIEQSNNVSDGLDQNLKNNNVPDDDDDDDDDDEDDIDDDDLEDDDDEEIVLFDPNAMSQGFY